MPLEAHGASGPVGMSRVLMTYDYWGGSGDHPAADWRQIFLDSDAVAGQLPGAKVSPISSRKICTRRAC